VPERVDELFDEYASAFMCGRRPAAQEFLARAGDGADELAQVIDAFLGSAPAPAVDEATVALFEAWRAGESPLVRLRAASGLELDALVAALVRILRLDVDAAAKVRRYYEALESGLLEPARVDRRVWAGLAELLGARVADLRSWRPRPPGFAAAGPARVGVPMAAMSRPAELEEPEDEVDRLFTRGRP
jgi:hypothetical protein